MHSHQRDGGRMSEGRGGQRREGWWQLVIESVGWGGGGSGGGEGCEMLVEA